jgi:hypothetical protein
MSGIEPARRKRLESFIAGACSQLSPWGRFSVAEVAELAFAHEGVLVGAPRAHTAE